MAAEDAGGLVAPDPTNAERSGQVFGPIAAPAAATAVSVVTTAPALTSYGFTSAQAVALLTAVNALLVDVASIRTALDALLTEVNP